MTSATIDRPRAAIATTTAPPTAPAPPTVEAMLRARTRYYQRHVLAWYALGRVQEARATWAALCDLRGRLADAQPASTPGNPALDARQDRPERHG
jgi:hypothetical protein